MLLCRKREITYEKENEEWLVALYNSRRMFTSPFTQCFLILKY